LLERCAVCGSTSADSAAGVRHAFLNESIALI
jgi:hypothetical protein